MKNNRFRILVSFIRSQQWPLKPFAFFFCYNCMYFLYRKSIKWVIVYYLLRDVAVLMNHIMIRIGFCWLNFSRSSSSCVHFALSMHHSEMKPKFYWNWLFWIFRFLISELSSKIRINDEYQKSCVQCVHHNLSIKWIETGCLSFIRRSSTLMAIILLFVVLLLLSLWFVQSLNPIPNPNRMRKEQ